MTLEELLAELRENVLRDISDSVTNDDADRLFSDASLIRYLNDGQVQFAAKTLCLRDETTPAITRITLVAGQESYDLHPSVKAVFGATIGDRHLSRTRYAALTTQRGDLSRGAGVALSGYACDPLRFYTDRESGKLGVWPAPGQSLHGAELVLRVGRLPLNPLKPNKLTESPEIPEEFHLDIVEWAAYRALRNHDADAEALAKASSHKRRFLEAVDELNREAKRLLAESVQFHPNTNWS